MFLLRRSNCVLTRTTLSAQHNVTTRPFLASTLRYQSTSTSTTTSTGGKQEVDAEQVPIWENPISHNIPNYKQLIENPGFTHHPPTKTHEKVAYNAVKFLRSTFDKLTGYEGHNMTKAHWLRRCLFLETVAGVPGMVGGMVRHLRSLRSMRRDKGWIHTLLEEAENERMHLLIFMQMKNPSFIFRTVVLLAQGIFFNLLFVTYVIHPKTCHRFVGYLEEEAVKTYTNILKDIENFHDCKSWQTELAPLIARRYYKLAENGTVYDMFKCIRADEANHRDVNHGLAVLNQKLDVNPFIHPDNRYASAEK